MAGRPRATGEPAGDSRQDLLDAAAALFIDHGYAATSTRAIADRAGLRQASLYHYFGGKEDILVELLEGTVRPSVRAARTLLGLDASPLAKLWALCRFDLSLLCGGQHNLGVLYLRPEIQTPRFTAFHAEHAELRSLYRTLVLAAGGDEMTADLVLGLVEGAVLTRQSKALPEDYPAAGADAGVRITGLVTDLDAVRAEGRLLL